MIDHAIFLVMIAREVSEHEPSVKNQLIRYPMKVSRRNKSKQIYGSPMMLILPDKNKLTIQYKPNVGFTGFDTFEYTVNDNARRTSNSANVTVLVK